MSALDGPHVIRSSVTAFIAECARQFDRPGRLLDLSPQEHEDVGAYFHQARIETLDTVAESGAFEFIVCAEMLARVADPYAAAKEIHRLLKEGGYAFITAPFHAGSQGQADRWRFTENGLRTLLNHFTIISCEPAGSDPAMPVHYRVIARKDHAQEVAAGPPPPEFSVLITCYYEERSIEEFHQRLSKAMAALGRGYEIIFVNDGSTDGTFEKLTDIYERDQNVSVIIDLFRNGGQAAAITAAVHEARGRAILLMDSDLQLAPEEIPLLVSEYDKGYDVVSGARLNRKDSWLRIVPSRLANIIMRKATQSTFRDFGCTFKIYNAQLVRAFDYGPHRLFSTVDVIARAGRRCEVPVTHFPRKYGKSGWTLRKLLKYNSDNLVSLSERPFQILAGICLAAALLFCGRIILGYLLPFRLLASVSTGLLLNAIVISLLITIAVLCLIGEFAIRAFLLGRQLPVYIIREIRRRTPMLPSAFSLL